MYYQMEDIYTTVLDDPALDAPMYGTPRHSGRYPWGSGKNPYQRNKDFYARVTLLRSEGKTNKEIADELGISTTELKAKYSIAVNQKRKEDIDHARKLKAHGYSNVKIGEMMSLPESTIRNYIKPDAREKTDKTSATALLLKDELKNNIKYLDIGPGTELYLGVTRTRLDTAVAMLKEEGYVTHNVYVDQLGTSGGQKTTIKVLCPPGTKLKELIDNKQDISILDSHSFDNGKTWYNIESPESIDYKRISIVFAENGGAKKDGVIEIRRGVPDVSLQTSYVDKETGKQVNVGDSKYAQVRIAVDGTHYIKGMAMYSDDLPPGIDIRFNTSKHEGTPIFGTKDDTVLKPLKDDPDNPFGAVIKMDKYDGIHAAGQSHYLGADGKEHLSVINKVKEEGDWNQWSKSLASQFLSKQNLPLAKKQLNLSYAERQEEFAQIMSLTNPVVKKRLLEGFAANCDSASIKLKSAALPRQRYQVILPISDMKDNEIYAPNYHDGEEVVLIRYPHGGTFEIPRLIVNNRQKTAKSLIFNAQDAVGINASVAARLSGADFDGDTVLVIPTANLNIRTSRPLPGLVDFDPHEMYKLPESAPWMKNSTKQNEMGKISNLITDMTLGGASEDELERAVKHSMVVIDAEKHHLDYKQSYKDNNIDELKRLYQRQVDPITGEVHYGGAATLISRAKSTTRVDKRKKYVKVDPETGEKIYSTVPDRDLYYKEQRKVKLKNEKGRIVRDEKGEPIYVTDPATGKPIYEDTGKIKTRQDEITLMENTKDAHTLSSGTPMEELYANYANQLKALANRARKEAVSTPIKNYSPEANKEYTTEVSSLNAKLNEALKNSPRERQAQLLGNDIFRAKLEDNPTMNNADKKKTRAQALNYARDYVGAHKSRIDITDREWEAIQKGAISPNKLSQILNNADLDLIKERSMPRDKKILSDSKIALAKSMMSSGYSTDEIAQRLGVSTSTINRYLYK